MVRGRRETRRRPLHDAFLSLHEAWHGFASWRGTRRTIPARRSQAYSNRIAKFALGYAVKVHWSESDFQLVTINGAPGLVMRHPIAGNGTYSFDIADGRIRAIYVVRNPDKLRGFLRRAHASSAPWCWSSGGLGPRAGRAG